MEELLNLLADGRFHSGEALGESLRVSRAAVWKKIKSLETLGLTLDSVKGRGYRLHPGVELLSQEKIVDYLDVDTAASVKVQALLETTSTNDQVRDIIVDRPDLKAVCLAEYQSGGRGRRGRVWNNPFGSNICLSLRWFINEGMASLEGLSLAVGVSVVKALESCGASHLKLKWPNDVLWQSENGYQKLSGILLEVHGDPTGECEVIIGIGVNVALTNEQIDSIGQPAVDMTRICGKAVSRNRIAGAVINELSHMLDGFGKSGFAAFREQWLAYDAFAGRKVMLDASGKKVAGIAGGVNQHGALLLENADGVLAYSGGEVSLREQV
ncbi:bifunctional biotin--[acetyl-CoA-carboxylase] ligase/biotin operon repressor BirA [Endozoicomonas ascidiicola]|uniref:bifunctional biotin--[acetyl-CoA-carboxylase] ligase/biotin operon repressor BirA n=1 Tax=Endozoicomonas ascidiicola TaxID=1698521 RepID=UPI000831285D|nr:bifunctional biotin--[acetyl-CoA-carboxylase] ligase/biotin operon repressor BirA [Endozoicomonas ascidiicola]